MTVEELYQEVLLDHYKHTRCHGCVHAPTAETELFNPLCGDRVAVSVKLEDGRLVDVAFSGQGCAISQASASMMSELCHGKTVDEIHALGDEFRNLMRGEKDADTCENLGDAAALVGVRKFSARIRCVMLAWEALEKCLEASGK